jgi:hypothetical protein
MKPLFFALLVVVVCKSGPKPELVKANVIPDWASQNINQENACKIIPSPGIKIITIGNTYTATFTIDGMLWYKQNFDRGGVYFSPNIPEWYNDSCRLKEDLRQFIKLQMVKYFVNASKVTP